MVLVHVAGYSAALALLALLSWLGRGWGYFVLYGLVVMVFALVVVAVWLGLPRVHRGDPGIEGRGLDREALGHGEPVA
jgi:hypothetical protein